MLTLVTTGILAGLAVLVIRRIRAARRRQLDHEAVLRALHALDNDIAQARKRILVMRGVGKPPTPAA